MSASTCEVLHSAGRMVKSVCCWVQACACSCKLDSLPCCSAKTRERNVQSLYVAAAWKNYGACILEVLLCVIPGLDQSVSKAE